MKSPLAGALHLIPRLARYDFNFEHISNIVQGACMTHLCNADLTLVSHVYTNPTCLLLYEQSYPIQHVHVFTLNSNSASMQTAAFPDTLIASSAAAAQHIEQSCPLHTHMLHSTSLRKNKILSNKLACMGVPLLLNTLYT